MAVAQASQQMCVCVCVCAFGSAPQSRLNFQGARPPTDPPFVPDSGLCVLLAMVVIKRTVIKRTFLHIEGLPFDSDDEADGPPMVRCGTSPAVMAAGLRCLGREGDDALPGEPWGEECCGAHCPQARPMKEDINLPGSCPKVALPHSLEVC